MIESGPIGVEPSEFTLTVLDLLSGEVFSEFPSRCIQALGSIDALVTLERFRSEEQTHLVPGSAFAILLPQGHLWDARASRDTKKVLTVFDFPRAVWNATIGLR